MDANKRRERASADAAEWWFRLQTEQLSREARASYVIWLRESPVHVAEMLRIGQVYGALDQFDRWSSISTDGAGDDKILELPSALSERVTLPDGSEGNRRVKGWVAVGALAAAVSGILVWPHFWEQTIETERGERREVALRDGSVIQVDPETTLRVKLAEDRRSIVLERGRALFRVAKDARRPFTVRANETVVRAIGTAFAVDRRTSVITVTVAEGKVAVGTEPPQTDHDERRALTAIPPGQADAAASEIFLTANQQITFVSPAQNKQVREIDASRELAWTEGRLVFNNTTIAEALAEFNRYNYAQLRVDDDTLANRPVSGMFNASDPESFVEFLQTVVRIQVSRSNGRDIAIAAQ